jgi:hypothetical protein
VRAKAVIRTKENAHDPRNSWGSLGALFESLEQWFNKTEQSYPRCSMSIAGEFYLAAIAGGLFAIAVAL